MTGKTRGIALIGACTAITTMGVLAYGQGSQAPNASLQNQVRTQLQAAAGGAATASTSAAAAMTEKDKVGYAIGYRIGESFKKESVDVDPDVVAQGMKAGMGQAKSTLTLQQMQQTLQTFQQEMMKKAMAKHDTEAKKNATESAAFLKANATKPGVHVTKTGLQYKILTPGTGPTPTASDTVTVDYVGTLPDGTVFDASAKHGGTAHFVVGGVIDGWKQALQMMKVGAKWRIWVPADLAYGEQGTRGGIIGPDQALIFDVTLVKIDKPAK